MKNSTNLEVDDKPMRDIFKIGQYYNNGKMM